MPTPVKIRPATKPRRCGATCGSTVGAASTMMTPPATPAAKRQVKNQATEIGIAQAKQATLASTIMNRSAWAGAMRAARGEATSAPAR
jgi:hypothetical protein